MSSNVDTRGVPDSLEYQPGAGKIDVNVYECVVCGTRMHGTGRAVDHDSCQLPRECPGCGSPHARPTLGVDHARVDVCSGCGLAFRSSGGGQDAD